MKTKEDGSMGSTMLQNPSDSDATFRKKAGKQYRGYVANIIESAGETGSIITDYQYEQNIHSDSQFLKEAIDSIDYQQEKVIIVADGAYGNDENVSHTVEKNIQLVTTDMTGR